ncbi:hypothetical protein [Roseiflexus castenholzii]|uniref:Uncharacterized protein n=1 Tax=Roseiflexus castenholzii (strain DSM 13941 / HLO8) TaxID=383372 RepID=A7NHY0_ROSCS|nr:hypothetical protein [Roseiflexus castenholzii]ABU57077.1 hypothetical protein Rcas_0964 [Roseiflexus castenholzii DSM 13941]
MERTLANINDRRPARRASILRQRFVSALAALLLGILNPLFCVLHCSLIDAEAHRYAPVGSMRFVCHLSNASHASAADQGHAPVQHSTAPRAVYDVVLMLLAMGVMFVPLTARLTPPARQRRNRESPAPPLPPPKLWHLLPVHA